MMAGKVVISIKQDIDQCANPQKAGHSQAFLTQFLDEFAVCMPRTMLRYSIERFADKKRQKYLHLK